MWQAYPPQPPYFPPPMAVAPLDPFRAYYAARLRELTFNSRPIIQDLSVQALAQRDQNNWTNMQSIVEEIEAATLRAPSHQKLPLLYLVDSISKNVGSPYTTHILPPTIPRLYLRTYREVDGVTKSKMEEMIGLWRTSGPDGGDLYGAAAREQIERDIWGSAGYQRAVMPTRDQVLQTLHATLAAKHRESSAKPWDNAVRQQVSVLMQIADLLNTTQVSPPELQQIMSQLKGMTPPAPVPSSMPPPIPTPQPMANTPPPTMHAPPNFVPHPPNPGMPPFLPATGRPAYAAPFRAPQQSSLATPPPAPGTPMPPSATPVPAPAPNIGIPANVADILRNLTSSGMLSQPLTPEPQKIELQSRSARDEYEDLILGLDLRLESIELNVPHALPINHLPKRCTQCGARFLEADSRFEAHLDWHFRRNRQDHDSGGRGAHRRWLPRAEEWVNDTPSAEAGPSTSTAPVNDESVLDPIRMAKLQTYSVRVPQDVRGQRPCPICKEAFKAEWSEDQEEWIWKNAVEVQRGASLPSVYYHAICRAEQQAAKKRLNPDGRRSKSGSPRVTPMPAEVKVEGSPVIKRKAESEPEQSEAGGEAKRVKVERDVAIGEGDGLSGKGEAVDGSSANGGGDISKGFEGEKAGEAPLASVGSGVGEEREVSGQEDSSRLVEVLPTGLTREEGMQADEVGDNRKQAMGGEAILSSVEVEQIESKQDLLGDGGLVSVPPSDGDLEEEVRLEEVLELAEEVRLGEVGDLEEEMEDQIIAE